MNVEEPRFRGYKRLDGTVGLRNHVLVLPTSVCSSDTAARISEKVSGTVNLYNQCGCCQIGEDIKLTTKTLIGLGQNPNVAAVLVVALGCEEVPYQKVADEIAETKKPVELIVIQEIGGTVKAIERGVYIESRMVKEASSIKREESRLNELIVALECGGSDWTSGIISNPIVGAMVDKLALAGGTAVFSETTEIIGAEHLLMNRTRNRQVAKKLLRAVARVEKRVKQAGIDLREAQPTPGNIAGGLTTIEEKSLGAICKAGKQRLEDVLGYADKIPRTGGLFFMDTPGQDIESITGMVAGGAQIVVFTTGLGTPTGCPIAPVIKVTGNSETFRRMSGDIDLNFGALIRRRGAIESEGARLANELLKVASGKVTKAEMSYHKEFAVYRLNPSV